MKRYPNWTLEDLGRLTDGQIHFLVHEGKAVRRTFNTPEEAIAAMNAEKGL
jgi:hypothetical protein